MNEDFDLSGVEFEADLAGLSGFSLRRLRRKLKRRAKKLGKGIKKFSKSKAFKAAVVIGAGAVAYSYAAPALKAAMDKKKALAAVKNVKSAKKKISKIKNTKKKISLMAKLKKKVTNIKKEVAKAKKVKAAYQNAGNNLIAKGMALTGQPLPTIPPTPPAIKAQLNQTIEEAQTLPEADRQKYLVESPAFQAKAEFKAKEAIKPGLYDDYIEQGLTPEEAEEMAETEASTISQDVTQNFVQKSQQGGGIAKLAIPAAIAALTMLV